MDKDQKEEQDFDLDDGFDDFADTTPKKSIPKGAIIGGVVLVIIIAIWLFGGAEQAPPSSVSAGSEVSDIAGSKELDPNMVEALETLNEDQRIIAIDSGKSFLPVPINPAQNARVDLENESDVIDPLESWRAIQREQMANDEAMLFSEEAEPVVDTARQEALVHLAEAMSAQMTSIIEENRIKEMVHIEVTPFETAVQVVGDEGGSSSTSDEDIDETVSVQIIPAATIEYAQTLIEANSDVDGPVLAEIVTGPLAGARALGSFTKEEDYLVIEFQTAIKDGKSYAINAIVLDPDTTLPAVATDVNRRWFRRVIIPAAAGFIEGFASAVAETAGTSTTIDTGDGSVTSTTEELDTEEEIAKGVEDAVGIFAGIIEDEYSNVETLVKVRAGTPIGLLFLDPVFEEDVGIRSAPSTTSVSGSSSNVANLSVETIK